MRLYAIIQHRRRLLMQFDPLERTPFSRHSPLKRPFAQQVAAHTEQPNSSQTQRPEKLPKLEFGSSFTAAGSSSKVFSPDFAMPSSGSRRKDKAPATTRFTASMLAKRALVKEKEKGPPTTLHLPLHDLEYAKKNASGSLTSGQENAPKSALSNFSAKLNKPPLYESTQGSIESTNNPIWRTKVTVYTDPVTFGIGDHKVKKESEKIAALSALYALNSQPEPPKEESHHINPTTSLIPSDVVILSDESQVNFEKARQFMDYYCRRYRFGSPDLEITQKNNKGRNSSWEATLTVGGRRIGLGEGNSKKAATKSCYLDVTQYLESCDPELWKTFVIEARTGKDLGLAQKVRFEMSERLEDEIKDLCYEIKKSSLYKNKPATSSHIHSPVDENSSSFRQHSSYRHRQPFPSVLAAKSQELSQRRQSYLTQPALETMRNARMSLPVFTQSDTLLQHIRDHDVTICMAATGSGKTTQVPQMILDEYVDKGKGAHCNILCTQPRRIAAISVANRVAKERGELLGESVGYQVRFDAKYPQPNGSITFCTTGIFLKRMQSALGGLDSDYRSMDDVTHVLVDEVHERDIDTDLLLVVLKRLMQERKAKNKPLKVVLMSATIDPALFQQYFADSTGKPCGVVDIPGRSFPVTKHYMDDYLPNLVAASQNERWVFQTDPVVNYLYNELGQEATLKLLPNSFGKPQSIPAISSGDLELPAPLIALTISHVLRSSTSGHVLVFLPGWDDIMAVQKLLLDPSRSLGLDFNDANQINIHLLHSTVPLAEQQVIFEPPRPGVRRVILATNIAETSVTIPDVVYVVDSAKVKEQRFDPERHMSALVSAWIGKSNLNQRAGRAGRHRSGEYFGILGRRRAEQLNPYQTVEMKRVDLSNVVMHVKALNFTNMTVEDVLASTIEPPSSERVQAALDSLKMAGALDENTQLTSLGRVLLQLPVQAQIGRLVLFGSFFRCLDQALTLAAILANRDPFVSPMHLKLEAAAKKNSWTPQEFRSDVLATLQAYNAWWQMHSRGEYPSANRFCSDNFLSKPTLLMIAKIKQQILESLYRAGVIEVSAGGSVVTPMNARGRLLTVPPELNSHGDSLPLLATLIAIASQPKFAIRTADKIYRTSHDKTVLMHPSSVNNRKRELGSLQEDINLPADEKQLFAYAEKRQNISNPGSTNAATFLVTTTRLDPMTYVLFGAYQIAVVSNGLECDGWLPIVGSVDALDDLQRLKYMMEACMLRVYEGITSSAHLRDRSSTAAPREEREFDDEFDSRMDQSLTSVEVKELDLLTRDIVRILNRYSDERMASQSRHNSRPATPSVSPAFTSSRLPSLSGHSTPTYGGSAYSSRPGTPSRLSRRF